MPAEFSALKEASPQLVAQAAQYRGVIQQLQRMPSAEGSCEALTAARPLIQSLGDHFTKAWEVSMAQAAASSEGPAALQSQLKQASDALPGMRLVMGADGIYRFIDYNAIAALAPKDSAASRLLHSAGELWSPINGWPSYIEQQTDVGGCTQLGQLRSSLEPLLAQWQAAPQCLREALLEPVRDAVMQATSSQCFCLDRPTTQRDADALTALLSEAPLNASSAVNALRRSLANPDSRFECQGVQ
jgi:hypothetical protein